MRCHEQVGLNVWSHLCDGESWAELSSSSSANTRYATRIIDRNDPKEIMNCF